MVVCLGFVSGCYDAERQALLKFKRRLNIPNNQLSSWTTRVNCCRWSGVGCDKVTGHVSHLDLGSMLKLTARAIDRSLIQLRHLNYLDLSGIDFLGSRIPGFIGSFKHLRYLSMHEANLSEVLPLQLGNLTKIETLNLQGNRLRGPLPSDLRNMTSLVNLVLSENSFNATIPLCLRNMTKLEHLDLSSNSFMGALPHWLADLKTLTYLYISNNSISGRIPLGIGNMTSLQSLDLSQNLFEGVFSNFHLANLSSLQSLYLYNNSLSLKFDSNWSPPFQLNTLDMSDCSIDDGELPSWIKSQTQLYELELSNTGISGELPQWFWNMSLAFMILSDNQIEGKIGNLSQYLSFIDLSNNLFSGSFPQSLSTCTYVSDINLSSNKLSGIIPEFIGQLPVLYFLILNNNALVGNFPQSFRTYKNMLVIMDVGENQLSGNIPSLNADTAPYLKILRLRGNKFVGDIPHQLCSLDSLQILDLASNNLTGNIPICFANFRAMHFLRFEPDPEISQSITEVMKGEVLDYSRNLKYVVDLDLSCNSLVGSIPEALTNLTGLIGLNLSHNHLKGKIPKKIGEMRSLESLDLANNHLSGTIPSSISALNSLTSLNLSYNKLRVEIPTGDQLQVIQDPSMAYIGNPGLCGDPLPNKCKTNNHRQQQHPQQEQQEDDKEDSLFVNPWFYLVIMSGFATGFWGVVGSLLLNRRFRLALFQHVSNVVDYLYVQVMVKINRLRN